jgi:subtilisin-like proprotein convertase family protein
MIKNFFTLTILVIVNSALIAQSFWKKTDETRIQARVGEERGIVPVKYQTFTLDIEGMKSYLANAPMETDFNRKSKELVLEIPMTNGKLEKFKVFESPVMQPGISARYPNIKTYKAYQVNNKSTQMRFSVAPNGFHAAIHEADGEKYIDPYSNKNLLDYIVYDVKDDQPELYKDVDLCGVNDEGRPTRGQFMPNLRSAGEVEMRVYKVAMACTGSWGAKRGTKEACLADMNTMLNRMNLMYEKDMAMRFILIDNNDKLIFTDPATDRYDEPNAGFTILPQNTSVLNSIISASSYDVGHVLATCNDIGGVAQGGSACQNNKGAGVTCHNNESLNNIVTRVMAHEVGHQFDASHTWNICTEYATQRAPNVAFEPGSGTTVMSYAGACSTDNVAGDNDDYFHVGSLVQMTAKTTQGGNAYACADKVATGNHFPEVTIPNGGFFIPISTPFELKGSATDEDGDQLTYVWEQYDIGEEVSLGTNSITAPLFRSYKPSVNGSVRFLPILSNLVAGKFTEKAEVLPSNTRDLTFRLTARDNNVLGGGVASEELKFKVTALAGPFELTYPKLNTPFIGGDRVDVTWNVANTDVAPVNCKFVNIYVSFNSTLRDDDVNLVPVALNVPNDGLQTVYVPNRESNFIRFVIKAVDNIFLTTGTQPSRITLASAPKLYVEAPFQLIACQPDAAVAELSTVGYGGLTGQVTFDIITPLPAGATASFSQTSVETGQGTTLTFNVDNTIGNITQDIDVRAIVAGVDTFVRTITLNIIGGNISNVAKLTPAPNAEGVGALPRYNWASKVDALSYEIQVATNPDFSPASVVTSAEVTDTTLLSNVILEKATVYYWRVRGINDCRSGEWSVVGAFITEALSCTSYKSGAQSINVSGTGTPTVEFPLTINANGTINDLNVTAIKADHARTVDLVVSLIAPSGKTSLLWSKKCNQMNINVGLDDQSPNFFSCPINNGRVLRPESPLSAFNGEAVNGVWKLKVEDTAPGSGGVLKEFDLEICSNISLDQPFLVNNKVLEIYPGNKLPITESLLLANDNNNTASELTYTLVAAPQEGTLTFNGVEIVAGAKFTQADINGGALRYGAISGSNGTDKFSFVVEDGQGGWIELTDFIIKRDDSFPNSSEDIILASEVFVNPNPTRDLIQIVLSDKTATFNNYQILDLAGRTITAGTLSSDISYLSLDNITSGIYLLKLTNGKQIITKRVVKI